MLCIQSESKYQLIRVATVTSVDLPLGVLVVTVRTPLDVASVHAPPATVPVPVPSPLIVTE